MNVIAKTPDSPYYAVIFTSVRTEGDNGYAQMADALVALAQNQPGFLGAESVRDATGAGITVSYWASTEAIDNWKRQALHQQAQQKGQTDWYEQFATRICKVERLGLFK